MSLSPLTVPMIVKSKHPVLSTIMLAAVLLAIVYVIYLMLCHEHRLRKARKKGHNLHHDGHHGSH